MDNEVTRIRKEIEILTARVAKLESLAPAIIGTQKPLPEPVPTASTPRPVLQPVPVAPIATPATPSEPLSGRLLGGAAILCFLGAAVYLIRLAVDSGWLTPIRQLGFAALFGSSLIAAGHWLKGKDAKYASLLPGAGLVVLWMCVYTGHFGLRVFDLETAMFLNLLLCMFSFALFEAFQQAYFLVVMIAGAYSMPLVFESGEAPSWLYFLIWDVLFCGLALKLKARGLICLAAYFALILFFGLAISHATPGLGAGSLVVFQAIQFGIFLGGTYLFSVKNEEPLSRSQAWSFAPVLLLFYVTEYALLDRYHASMAPWAALGFAGVLIALQFAAEKAFAGRALASREVTAAVVSIILFHAVYIELLPRIVLPWCSLGLLTLLPFVKRRGITFEDHPIPIMVIWTVIVCEYCLALANLTVARQDGEPALLTTIFNLSYCVLLVGNYVQEAKERKADGLPGLLVLVAGSLQGIAGFDRISRTLAEASSADYLCSGLVAAYAFALMFLAKGLLDRRAANVALVIFLGVSLKVLTVDLAESNSVVRVFTLIAVGALLYGGGLLSRKIPAGKAYEV